MKLLMMKMRMTRLELVCYNSKGHQDCALMNCSSAFGINSSPAYQMVHSVCGGGGRAWTVNTIHLAGPARSQAYHPDLTVGYRASNKTRYFHAIIL
jgi:hypothetical protein